MNQDIVTLISASLRDCPKISNQTLENLKNDPQFQEIESLLPTVPSPTQILKDLATVVKRKLKVDIIKIKDVSSWTWASDLSDGYAVQNRVITTESADSSGLGAIAIDSSGDLKVSPAMTLLCTSNGFDIHNEWNELQGKAGAFSVRQSFIKLEKTLKPHASSYGACLLIYRESQVKMTDLWVRAIKSLGLKEKHIFSCKALRADDTDKAMIAHVRSHIDQLKATYTDGKPHSKSCNDDDKGLIELHELMDSLGLLDEKTDVLFNDIKSNIDSRLAQLSENVSNEKIVIPNEFYEKLITGETEDCKIVAGSFSMTLDSGWSIDTDTCTLVSENGDTYKLRKNASLTIESSDETTVIKMKDLLKNNKHSNVDPESGSDGADAQEPDEVQNDSESDPDEVQNDSEIDDEFDNSDDDDDDDGDDDDDDDDDDEWLNTDNDDDDDDWFEEDLQQIREPIPTVNNDEKGMLDNLANEIYDWIIEQDDEKCLKEKLEQKFPLRGIEYAIQSDLLEVTSCDKYYQSAL